MEKKSKLSIFLRGIIAENPVLILILGTCPTLAATTSMFQAVSMGLAAMFVLLGSNVVVSLLRKIIPDSVRIPCYIVIIATFVTAVDLLLKAYLPPVHSILGSWLALIVVNCIVLGRAEMFARKNSVLDSVLDGLGMGVGFLVALLLMATVREVLGSGTILSGLTDFGIEPIKIPFLYDLKIPVLVEATGGFLVYGVVIAVMNKLTEKKGGVKRKSFSCEGCPSSHICNRTMCSELAEVTEDARNNATVKVEVVEPDTNEGGNE